VGVDAPTLLDGGLIGHFLPPVHSGAMGQIQNNGLDDCLSVFQEKLDHAFIFLWIISAGGINKSATWI
jgi:hypothetical protein